MLRPVVERFDIVEHSAVMFLYVVATAIQTNDIPFFLVSNTHHAID